MKYVKALACCFFTPISQRNDPFKQSGAKIFNAAEPYVWAAFFLFSANCGRKKQIIKF